MYSCATICSCSSTSYQENICCFIFVPLSLRWWSEPSPPNKECCKHKHLEGVSVTSLCVPLLQVCLSAKLFSLRRHSCHSTHSSHNYHSSPWSLQSAHFQALLLTALPISCRRLLSKELWLHLLRPVRLTPCSPDSTSSTSKFKTVHSLSTSWSVVTTCCVLSPLLDWQLSDFQGCGSEPWWSSSTAQFWIRNIMKYQSRIS